MFGSDRSHVLLMPPAHQHHSCRSRRTCSVCIKSTLPSGKRRKWSALSDGMPFWLTLRPCMNSKCQTSRPNLTFASATCACLPCRVCNVCCMDCLHRRGPGSPLQQLEQACQSWAPEDRAASSELNDWQHQLRSLVQAGIPMVRMSILIFT